MNRSILADVARVLRPRGRLVLDVYDRDYHARLPLRRTFDRGAERITEERRFEGPRLFVRLTYATDPTAVDRFEWELFTAEELAREGAAAGLALAHACADFDDRRVPTGDASRMQLVFERAR